MRNIFPLAQEVGTGLLLQELVRFPNLWNKFPVRKLSDKKEYDDVIVRFQKFDSGDDIQDRVQTLTEVVNYPTGEFLTQVRPLVHALLGKVGGEHLGAVIIGRLGVGQTTESAPDRFPEAEAKFPDRIPPGYYYDRYLLGLSGGGGVLECGGEVSQIPVGTLVWFNNQLSWAVANSGPDEFQFLLVDVALPRSWYYPK